MDRFKKAKIRSIFSTLDPLATIQLVYLVKIWRHLNMVTSKSVSVTNTVRDCSSFGQGQQFNPYLIEAKAIKTIANEGFLDEYNC